MTTVADALVVANHVPASEGYADLLRSGPHWLFELTVEAVSTPLAIAFGWLWRSSVLHHVHRDLRAVGYAAPRRCVGRHGRRPRRPCHQAHGARGAGRFTDGHRNDGQRAGLASGSSGSAR